MIHISWLQTTKKPTGIASMIGALTDEDKQRQADALYNLHDLTSA